MAPTGKPRLRQKLVEQLEFLRRSCSAFDEGLEDEALRIAVSLRIIFHDTGKSTSLVKHLNLGNRMMLSSSRGLGDYRDYLSFQIHLCSPEPIKMLPLLDRKFRKMPLSTWWHEEPIFVHGGQTFTRRMVVLSAANKDGGAHVDEELESYYEVLCAGKYGLGITGDLQYRGAIPFEQGSTHYAKNTHLALIRQFAHEVLASAKQFRWRDEIPT